MKEPSLEALAQRLECVERVNRRLKRAGAAVAVGIVALLLMGQTLPKRRVVEAQEFVVKDDSGRVFARLGSQAGLPSLTLFDKNQTPRVTLDLAPDDGLHLSFVDKAGRLRAGIFTAQNGDPGIFFADKAGKVRISIEVSKNDTPRLDLSDKEGKSRAQLIILEDGQPVLRLSDPEEKPLAILATTPGGGSGLSLWDQREKLRAVLRTSSDGRPGLELRDEDGKLRAALGSTSLQTAQTGEVTQRAESSLVLFDRDGKALWRAP